MSIKLSKKLQSIVGKTNATYGLIKEGDKVLVGLSGGKDSLTLIHAIKHLQRVTPFDFTFQAVTIGYGMGEQFDYLQKHCDASGIDYKPVETNIYDTAQTSIRKNSSFCSYFSRMRRGALYNYALEHGFNKLALGHHLDDAAESFFMNFMYNGAIRSMPPIYKAYNDIEVIRPLIFARERQLRAFADDNGLSTIGDEACPAMKIDIKMPYARANTKELLAKLEADNPELFISLKAAFKNVQKESFCGLDNGDDTE
jgi:tRNA(Ile)-lysidine synthase TilS/MesJ